jgi:inosose dehydratase
MQNHWTITTCHSTLLSGLSARPSLLGYCPLGQGKVNIPGILDLMAGRKIHGMVMGELDHDPKSPSPAAPVELVKTSKLYLETLGITFRA